MEERQEEKMNNARIEKLRKSNEEISKGIAEGIESLDLRKTTDNLFAKIADEITAEINKSKSLKLSQSFMAILELKNNRRAKISGTILNNYKLLFSENLERAFLNAKAVYQKLKEKGIVLT